MQVSFLTVVRNEEELLPLRLQEVEAHVDEIVVVHDGECSDQTLELAGKFTDKVVVAPYRGYCEPQRQVGLELCTGDWVLVGDADEQFTLNFRNMLRHYAVVAEEQGSGGVLIGRWEKNLGDGVITYHCRFFRRAGAYFTDVIHTAVEGVGKLLCLPGYEMVHYSRTDGVAGDRGLLAEKGARYARVQAELQKKYADHPEVLAHLCTKYTEGADSCK